MTGHYIALEGIEGAGKTTVSRQLAERLAVDLEVVAIREPGGTGACERIREVLLHSEGELGPWTEALLFAASRAQLAVEIIKPALERGAYVVSDRTVYSSLAYQGGARGLGVAEVRRVNELGLAGVWPDLVLLLRVDADSGLRRQAVADRIGAEGAEFHEMVADAYQRLADAEPDRIEVLDASLDIAQVVDQAEKLVRTRW